MSIINSTAPIGWNKWSYAKNFFDNVQLPDAPFPYLYTPSSGIWSVSSINHCLIPWLNTQGAFTTFLLGGGSTGTFNGALAGLEAVGLTADIALHGQIFGVGRGALPPQMGYCIGNKLKQHVYTRMDVQNDGMGGTITTNTSIELLQNSRFKRAFVKYGTVLQYNTTITNGTTTHILTLDIDKNIPPPSSASLSGTKITITKLSTDGKKPQASVIVSVLGIQANWDVIISAPETIIESGDYYELNEIWCLEDPYLLSGFWLGSEDSLNPPITSSGMNLYVTSHNSPYQEGKFLRTYI